MYAHTGDFRWSDMVTNHLSATEDMARNSIFPTPAGTSNPHHFIDLTSTTCPPSVHPNGNPAESLNLVQRPMDQSFGTSNTVPGRTGPNASEAEDHDTLLSRRLREDDDQNLAREPEQESKHGRSMVQFLSVGNSPASELTNFLKKVADSRCRQCGSRLWWAGNAGDIVARTKGDLDSHGILHPFVTCTNCKTRTKTSPGCTCKSPHQDGPDLGLPHRVSGENLKVAWCCDHGRLFLIWCLCCGIEYKKPEEGRASTAKEVSKQLPNKLKGLMYAEAPGASTKTPSAFAKGVGYGSSDGSGWDDFDDSGGSPSDPGSPGDSKAAAKTKTVPALTRFLAKHRSSSSLDGSGVARGSEEYFLMLYFKALTLLLRGDERKRRPLRSGSTFDANPPLVIEYMVSRSALLPRAAGLLRNDSIEYVSALEDVYVALLDLVEAMGSHQRTSSLIFIDYTVYPLKDQLLDISISSLQTNTSTLAITSRPRGVRVEGNRLEKSASISQCLKDLAAQCHHFIHIASRSSSDFSTSKDGQREIRVSRRIIAIASHIEAEQVKRGGRNKSAPGDFSNLQHTVMTRSKETSALLGTTRTPEEPREACIVELPDETILSNFHFSQGAEKLATLAPGRMRALVSQVSNLRSSLPKEGIWVRHGSSRLDAMKILIMGPKDTPYHYGLFEFDLFCPAEFPQKPPKMSFRSTGGGRVRFNPNLYENGVVCLSLLGTWGNSANNKKKGEGWDERISTLLQVLLSIQAMVFVDEPYYNEPGRERSPNKANSEAYNAKIREYTVQHVMLHWLHQLKLATPQEAPKPDRQDHPIWGAVIREHFKANGTAIMETTKKWKEPNKKSSGLMEMLRTQVQAGLTEHGFIN